MRSLTRRLSLMSATALVIAVPVTAACAAGTTARRAASLSLIRRSPVTVVGHNFRAHRRVHLTVTAAATQTRTAMPNAAGTFTTTFSTSVDRCSGYRIVATQPGRAPVILRGAKPACIPMGTP